MEHEIIVKKCGSEANISEIDAAAADFLRLTSGDNVVAFYAPMGAGKTTFISALCRCLNVRDDVCSPTFTIINEYLAADGRLIYHFDLYRIDKLEEALDLGLDDYFCSGNLCLIEWPEKIEQLLPEDCLKVHIEVRPDESRRMYWNDQL